MDINATEDEKEIIKNIEVERDLHNNIKLAPILRKLADYNLSVKDTSISYKSHLENAWIFVAKDPIPEDFAISVNDLEP